MNIIKNKKILVGSILFLAVLIFAAAIIFFARSADNKNAELSASFISSDGKVLGEEENAYQFEYKSDTYRVPQLAFGGGLTSFYPGLGEPLGPLDFDGVQSAVVKAKEKNELQLFIKWKTKRPTMCTISFAKVGGQEKYIEENYYSNEHNAVVRNLESASTYFYRITAKDKLGGEAGSDKYAVYSGAPEVSFFDLLAGAFNDAFGWAIKK